MYTDKYSNETAIGPSMAVVHARHRAVMARGRCRCGSQKDPSDRIRQAGGRRWISCDRCLGSIKQLS